jgi:hypothetical protein
MPGDSGAPPGVTRAGPSFRALHRGGAVTDDIGYGDRDRHAGGDAGAKANTRQGKTFDPERTDLLGTSSFTQTPTGIPELCGLKPETSAQGIGFVAAESSGAAPSNASVDADPIARRGRGRG